jgi:hypothetical protein
LTCRTIFRACDFVMNGPPNARPWPGPSRAPRADCGQAIVRALPTSNQRSRSTQWSQPCPPRSKANQPRTIRWGVADRAFREYHVSVVFHAPLPFVFAWCTDYSPNDANLAGEDKMIHLRRRIVSRTARQVVFENMYDEGRGWAWERHTVTLKPPNRWHSDGFGNYHEAHLDYRLKELPNDRTEFDMRWRSRSTSLSKGRLPPRETVERFVQELWHRRGQVLEREYQKGLVRKRHRISR